MRRGKLLANGVRIGLLAPASPISNDQLQQSILFFEKMGFELTIGHTCYESYGGYLAGSPGKRAKELNDMFSNPDIQAIFCARGGYGTPQLLDLLDYEMIAENPKLFIGYSDITALHIAFQQKCNLATIHGPMPASDLITADEFTIKSLFQVIQNDEPYQIKNPPNEEISCLVPGVAKGILTGGNLSLVTGLLGTPYEIDTKGKILFLEEIGEQPYKVDRMLTQLDLAGKLKDAAGFVLGTWTKCEAERKESFNVQEVIENMIVPYKKPAIYNLRAGHCSPAVTLPFGLQSLLDAENKSLTIGVK
ncbi:S66 peptidase family protein [Pseudogracilibacillus auburnensis]|uniref:S66 peptidase family protein n=1 Tax=Pseudogracilibacillus auburnensis TaxID=1494959 RepID=UPI001A95DCE5|nr:LD-carboxypeptidase [Pseudogracilibacillus auburnensis]MBO1003935.1 LD-carboxypeptidase [Pseudogracilibacillus auburnensis]